MTTVDQTTATAATGEVVAVEPPHKRVSLQQQQRRWGWIFLSPWIFGFVVFTAAPIVASLIFTFTDFSSMAVLEDGLIALLGVVTVLIVLLVPGSLILIPPILI